MDKKKKTLVFSLLIAAGMLLPMNLSAQEHNGRPGGLFGVAVPTESNGLMGRSESTAGGHFTGQGFGATNGNITGQTFGDNAPLGSGLFVLLVAGAGYATIKSREKHQNRKEK